MMEENEVGQEKEEKRMDVMKLANSLPMWIACGIPVVFVMIQALLFAREAYRSGEKVGLNETQMNKAIKVVR